MEAILDQAQKLMEAPEKNKEEYLEYQGEIEKLAGYYESPKWKEDLALDEEGALPQDLKRESFPRTVSMTFWTEIRRSLKNSV